MLLFGSDFEFNGKLLSSYGGKVVTAEKASLSSGLSRSVQKGETGLYRRRANHYGAVYNDVLTFDIGIVKEGNGSTALFTREEIREINKWLTSPNYPRKLRTFNFEGNNSEVYSYYGVVTDVNYDAVCLSGGDYVPQIITATIQCDSPYAWKECSATLSEGKNIINVDDDELEGYTHPLIKISPNNTSGIGERVFSLKNNSDGGKLFTAKIASRRDFYLDCQKMKIYDELG